MKSFIGLVKKNKVATGGAVLATAIALKLGYDYFFSDEAKEESLIKHDIMKAAKAEADKKIDALRKEREAKAAKEKVKAAEANENQTKGKTANA